MMPVYPASLPSLFLVAAFFFLQQLFQLGWLYRPCRMNPNKPHERHGLDEVVNFTPDDCIGNLCIAGNHPIVLDAFSIIIW